MFPTIRNLNEKLNAWVKGHGLTPDHFIGASWSPQGVCCFPKYPTLKEIESWFISKASCEDCGGKGFIPTEGNLPNKICPSCKSSGFRKEFR